MISQITPAGLNPAKRARSTAASVCPARTRTPPSRANSGKIWPGVVMSSGVALGATAAAIVRARSGAEIPVVTPSRASIDTVKAVPKRLAFFCGISSRPRRLTCSPCNARQISPRPYFAMKLMASGVAIWAGITRSPSFSRSSSSTRMNIRPLRASSMISSIEDRKRVSPAARVMSCFETSEGLTLSFGAFFIRVLSFLAKQARNISGQRVHLKVHPIARFGVTKSGF